MQRIYEPESLLEAELLIGMLRSEGIKAHLSGRDLMGAVVGREISPLPGLSNQHSPTPVCQRKGRGVSSNRLAGRS